MQELDGMYQMVSGLCTNFAKGGMEKRGGRKLTIVLCEAQGGATPYTCYAGKCVVSLF